MDGNDPSPLEVTDHLAGLILDLVSIRDRLKAHAAGNLLVSIHEVSQEMVTATVMCTSVRNELRGLAAADLAAHMPRASPVPSASVAAVHG